MTWRSSNYPIRVMKDESAPQLVLAHPCEAIDDATPSAMFAGYSAIMYDGDVFVRVLNEGVFITVSSCCCRQGMSVARMPHKRGVLVIVQAKPGP
eukprot:scaffold89907_cov31-Tisochrysis_lutea.AAC.3